MKRNLLKNDGVQSLLASLVCVVLGLFLGYVVLLAINPAGAGEAILTVIKNFLTYNRPSSQLKYLGNTLVKTAPLLMCALSILFAYKVGLFNIGAAGQYVVGAGASLYCALGLGMPWYVCLLAAIAAGADGLTIETRLFELAGEALGREVPLATLPATAQLQPSLLLPGVRGAQVNPRIGTALVTYDANMTNREEILRWIATAVDTGLELAQEVDWTKSDVGEEELATMARRRLALRLGQAKK